jgi:hypothetical protein
VRNAQLVRAGWAFVLWWGTCDFLYVLLVSADKKSQNFI